VYGESQTVACEVLGPPPPPNKWLRRLILWLRRRLILVIVGGLLLIGGSAWAILEIMKPAQFGESCDADKDCDVNLLCVPGVQKCRLAGGVSCIPTQADPMQANQCASGECKSGSKVCAIPLGGACNSGDKDAVLCPKHSTCDPATKTCLRNPPECQAGARQCTPDGKGFKSCDGDGKWKPESCPANAPQCRDGKCQCAADQGKSCNCGGTVQCDGTCSAQPCSGPCEAGHCCVANKGTLCGSCGGTVQCDGTCSKPNPPNLNQSCGSCGGTVQCDGTCSKPNPSNLNQSCGSCGGTIQCDSTCSRPNPLNLGASCNCSGRVLCDGSCTAPPFNPGQPCTNSGARGECGAHATVTCVAGAARCTPAAPSPERCDGLDNDCDGFADPMGICPEVVIRQQSDSDYNREMTWSPGSPFSLIDGYRNHFPGSCGTDDRGRPYIRTRVEVHANSPHGAICELVGPYNGFLNPDPTDCTIRVHYRTRQRGSNVWCNGTWWARPTGPYLR
jgi:hypothetical protein